MSEELIEKLRELFQSMPTESLPNKGDGWVKQYAFQRVVTNERIYYKNLGYQWFSELLDESDLFSSVFEYSEGKKIYYIRDKEKYGTEHRRPRISRNAVIIDSDEVTKLKRRLRLENNQFIGQFTPQLTEGWYKITDIRNTDFTKIEDKERGIKDLAISFKSTDRVFNRFAYYQFTWKLLESSPIKFGFDYDAEVKPIYPSDIVRCLHDGIMRYPSGAAKKISRSLDTLKKQLTQSGKEVFIYELLQNANDYPRHCKDDGKVIPVDVEFYITKNYLTFQHTGDYFNPKNIAAICDINDGEKADKSEAIGYKGIGFKTVFLDNDYVLLNTGNYSFRFDKSATDVINTPWQILPIWTNTYEISEEIRNIFGVHPSDEYRVKFALQPRDRSILSDKSRKDNYIDLFSDIFDSERVILFIPNINKVCIFIEGNNEPIVRVKDSSNWCVSESLIDSIPEFITEKINDVLNNPDSLRSDGYEKIPEKYLNFRNTSVKFACQKDGRFLKPVDNAILYCYLPAKRADWGFDFLMNTDMVPNGQRDDIEDIELNHEITRIAGRQFFYWIKQLIDSEEYDLDSIFSLIPDFEECKKRKVYKEFINEFQEGFESLIKEEPFIPAINKNNELSYKCVDDLINDMTGLTSNDVMSDESFLSIMGLNESYLPIRELRQSKSFNRFLYRHSPSEFDITIDTVKSKCGNDEFQEWLKDDKNNTLFINHWLGEDRLDIFANEDIFIEYKGDLYAANDLYYDFETNCGCLGFLRRFIPHLCDSSKRIFDNNKSWLEFADSHFKTFSAKAMILDYILPNEEAVSLLREEQNSLLFFRFLANNNIDLQDDIRKVPYILEDGEALFDYDHDRYFFSEDSLALTKEAWLGDNVIHVLSHIYFDGEYGQTEDNLKKLFSRLGFFTFEKEAFIKMSIVGNVSFREKVNAAIDNNFSANKAFIDYVLNSGIQLKDNSLKDYVLCCIDLNAQKVYLCNDDVRYFNQDSFAKNSTYKDNIGYSWLKADMMYELSNTYFDSREKENSKLLEQFLRQQFGVKTFTDKSFFFDVVLKNKSIIYDTIKEKNEMLAFLEYLKRDSERIFDDTVSFNNIKDMPLLCYDGSVIKTREANLQYIEYDDEAKVLCEKQWFPSTYIMLDKAYTDNFSQDMRQLFKITKFEINEVINNMTTSPTFKTSITSLESSIDFWRWIRYNQKKITSFDELCELPIINHENIVSASMQSLYISDAYLQDGIESLVTRYVPSAQFVSSDYLDSNTETEQLEWLKLFKKLGLKSENKDILFSDILPAIDTFEEDSIVSIMTKHLKDLKEVWNEKRHQIIKLRVRARSGEYKTINQLFIVNLDDDSVSEPFKYIFISNEVHPDILKGNKELLLLISNEYCNQNLITSKQNWIAAKVKEYLKRVAEDESSVDDIHIKFIREVAKLNEEYSVDYHLLKQIKYRTKSTTPTYLLGSELTLGSYYSPTCDFEANGVVDLAYLSDEYLYEDNKDIIKLYFKAQGLHHNMMREDLRFLSNRTFACYFWSKLFSRRLTEYETWINEGCFESLMCIPTENAVQKPELLYALDLVGYVFYGKAPHWQEKVPCKAIVESISSRDARDLFCKLSFCKTLSFEDCIYYLANANSPRDKETEYREKVVNWILEAPEIDTNLVSWYRGTPSATWRNGKGQKKHISELFTIHPNSTQEKNIFYGDEYVMQSSAFPNEPTLFERICKILQIKCLNSNDFIATPVGIVDETEKMIRFLRPRLLVLSAIENDDRFQELYDRYNAKLSQYHYVQCEKIDLGFETIHSDVERIYNDDNHLYYVGSWKHNRTYLKFCNRIKKLIGFNVYDDVCEDVLDENTPIETCIDKYCSSLSYDKKFQSYLESLDLSINVELEEEPFLEEKGYYREAEELEDNDYSQTSSIDDTQIQNLNTGNDYATVEKDTIISDGTSATQTVAPQSHSATDVLPSSVSDNSLQDTSINTLDKETVEIEDVVDPIDDDMSSVESIKRTPNSHNTKHQAPHTSRKQSTESSHVGSVDDDIDYQPIGSRPYNPRSFKRPNNYKREDIDRMRSNGIPLELESLPPTTEEIDLLAQCNITPEQIADTNYLAQLRLYLNLTREQNEEPEETMEEFVRNANDVTTHKIKSRDGNGRYIHTCSAARGVMYVSPSVWKKMVDDKWRICIYLDGQGKNFHYINNAEEFLEQVNKDDLVLKITGKEKVDVVNALYSSILDSAKGTAYTLVRVASRTNMDAVFAHYVGAMAETNDGNEDINDYD